MLLLNLFILSFLQETPSSVAAARGAWGGDSVGLCGVKRVLGEVLLPWELATILDIVFKCKWSFRQHVLTYVFMFFQSVTHLKSGPGVWEV